MATYGGGFKVSGAISGSVASTGTLYSCPAAKYGSFQICWTGGGAGTTTITIGGQNVISASSAGTPTYTGLFSGPGQAVAVSINTGGAIVTITGAEFANS